MTKLDIGVVSDTVLFLVRGVWVGFVRQLAFFLALTLGYLAAGKYYTILSQNFSPWIENAQLRFVVTYTLLFLITYVLVMFLGRGMKKVMQVTFLGWFDRTMGGLFGLAKAAFISTLVFMGLAGVLSSGSPIIQKSFFSQPAVQQLIHQDLQYPLLNGMQNVSILLIIVLDRYYGNRQRLVRNYRI